jgi:hypothetical protein
MPMTRTQNLVAVSRKILSRLGSLPTGEPPDDLLNRQALEGKLPPAAPEQPKANAPLPVPPQLAISSEKPPQEPKPSPMSSAVET